YRIQVRENWYLEHLLNSATTSRRISIDSDSRRLSWGGRGWMAGALPWVGRGLSPTTAPPLIGGKMVLCSHANSISEMDVVGNPNKREGRSVEQTYSGLLSWHARAGFMPTSTPSALPASRHSNRPPAPSSPPRRKLGALSTTFIGAAPGHPVM